MSTPASALYMCAGVRLNTTYDHTIYFDTPETQNTYFYGKCVRTFALYTYVRKTRSVKVEAPVDEARGWSYMYFANADGKRYYCFITRVDYINDNVSEVFFDVDVMQTYAFDYDLLDCYVEREHLDPNGDDAPMFTDEGLDVGEYVVNKQDNIDELTDAVILCLATLHPTKTTENTTTQTVGRMANNVFFGNGVYATLPDKAADLQASLRKLDTWGKTDGIMAMWMYPKALITLDGAYSWEDGEVCKTAASATEMDYTFGMQKTLQGYEPHNAKLLTHPYNYLYVSNNNGQAATYRYEYFNMLSGLPSWWINNVDNATHEFKFRIFGTLSPEGVCKLVPLNYKDASADTYNVYMEEGLTLTGFPHCSWNSDQYKLWLAQNQNSIATTEGIAAGTSIGGAALTALGAVLTATGVGAPLGMGMVATGAGMAASGATTILSQNAAMADKAKQPPAARGAQSGSINMAVLQQTFTAYHMSVTRERAKQLDAYFDMYGYSTKSVKVPNTHSHRHFNYVKTVGSNVVGNFPHDDLAKINAIFDRGVTFWKNGDKIGDYSIAKTNNPTA